MTEPPLPHLIDKKKAKLPEPMLYLLILLALVV